MAFCGGFVPPPPRWQGCYVGWLARYRFAHGPFYSHIYIYFSRAPKTEALVPCPVKQSPRFGHGTAREGRGKPLYRFVYFTSGPLIKSKINSVYIYFALCISG